MKRSTAHAGGDDKSSSHPPLMCLLGVNADCCLCAHRSLQTRAVSVIVSRSYRRPKPRNTVGADWSPTHSPSCHRVKTRLESQAEPAPLQWLSGGCLLQNWFEGVQALSAFFWSESATKLEPRGFVNGSHRPRSSLSQSPTVILCQSARSAGQTRAGCGACRMPGRGTRGAFARAPLPQHFSAPSDCS